MKSKAYRRGNTSCKMNGRIIISLAIVWRRKEKTLWISARDCEAWERKWGRKGRMIFVFFIKNRAAAVLAIVKLMFIRGIKVHKAVYFWWHGRDEGLDANKQCDDGRACAKVPLSSLGMCWDGAAVSVPLSSVHLDLLPYLPIPTTQIS